MENENNRNESNGSTYHYGRNESPHSIEDVSGRQETNNTNTSNGNTYYTQQTADSYSAQNGNPYKQGSVYGQGIYTGNDFATAEENQPKKKKAKKEKKPSNGKAKKAVKFVASAVAFGLIAGGVMFGVNMAGNKLVQTEKADIEKVTTVKTDSTATQSSDNTDGKVAQVAEEVMPSIVSITNKSVEVVRSWFQSYEQEVSGSGSGIIIGQSDKEILVVTNNHVISGAKELTVSFADETSVEATVKGYDETADLAVVAVDVDDVEKDTLSKIKVAAMGSSDDLKVGENAIAIGNALGYGQSVTVGYISALNREVEIENKTMTLLQTDAAINPGNSGGALLNSKGEVIGINTVKFVDSQVEGMGYAIPISTAIPIINDLMNTKVIEEEEQGYLGIQGNDVTQEYEQGFNMPQGVYIVKIVEGSPADKCGLKAGDIITKFGDRDVKTMQTLQTILSGKKAGEKIEMLVQRNNEKGEYEEVTLTVTLGAKKDMPKEAKEDSNATTEQSTENEKNYYPDDSLEDFFDILP